MTIDAKKSLLFLSALKEVARQYPRYFLNSENLDEVKSIWDLQPHYHQLEHLLLEEASVQYFVFAVWSFFSPVSFGKNGIGEMTRPLQPWQKELLVQLILNDPIEPIKE